MYLLKHLSTVDDSQNGKSITRFCIVVVTKTANCGHSVLGVIIKNKEIADAFRAHFELVWSQALKKPVYSLQVDS